MEIGVCWEPEGAILKLSADLFGPWVVQVGQTFLVIVLKQVYI